MRRVFSGLGAPPVKFDNFPAIPAGYIAAGICLGVAISFGVTSLGNSQLRGGVTTEARIETGETVRGPLPAIDANSAAALMKSTIIAVQQANQTGNYSVLRDLGTPAFRESFDQARLTAIFASLRASRTDLSNLVLSFPSSRGGTPEFAANKLRLSGEFLARSQQIRYDLTFVWIGEQWRVEALAIDTIAVKAISGAQSPSSPAAKNSPPEADRPTYPS